MIDTVTDWHSEALCRCFDQSTTYHSKREKTCCSSPKQIYNIRLTLKRWRCEMKLYDELKTEIEAIQQQMIEFKKNERTNALKEVKRLFKEFGFTAGMLKGALFTGRKKQ
ncbi:hypothetical protein N9R39_03855 [Amylibacter sp.]|nr:hypothetical protein [Amylibacter sp.]